MDGETNELLIEARKLSPEERVMVMDMLDAFNGVSDYDPILPPEPKIVNSNKPLTNFQRAVVDEYGNCVDPATTARALGVDKKLVDHALNQPNVVAAATEKLIERSERTELTADYIRGYIYELLELCPTDHFTTAEDGTWMIDPEQFKKVPKEIRRLVESTELKKVGKDWLLVVKFMSKSAALSLAAKYSLVEKHSHDVNLKLMPPWDDIARDVRVLTEEDEIERAIAEAGKQ